VNLPCDVRGEEVSSVVGGIDFDDVNKLLLHPVLSMMNSDVNMLRALVVHRVVCQVRCSSVFDIHWNRCANTRYVLSFAGLGLLPL